MISRRAFVASVTGSLFAAPLAVGAQQAGKVPKIGFLGGGTAAGGVMLLGAFEQGMKELGYVDGRLVWEARFAEGNSEKLPALARELVGLKPDVIVTSSDAATAAAKRETRTIPIVMVATTDPVGTGFATSLAHPGGNITGF